MPSLPIPAKLRFALYIASALGSVFVIYAIQKGWAGDAENQLWLGISGLLAALAASKTPVKSEDEAGQYDALGLLVTVLVIVILVLVVLRLA